MTKKVELRINWYVARLFIAAIIAAVIALIFFSAYRLWTSLNSPRERPVPDNPNHVEELPPPNELERAVKAINSRLSKSKILEEGVRVEGRSPSARFTIASDHPNYYFQPKDYTIETGGDVQKIPTSSLCNLINKVEQEKNLAVLEALDQIDIEAEIGSSGGALKSSGTLRKYFEIWYALQQFGDLPKRRAEILLKGYADGKQSEWTALQEPGRYHFPEIPVLFPIESELGSHNPVTFSGTSTVVTLPERYANKHLPDLRAAFFKKDFIDPFLHECWSIGSVDVYILKGYEFKDHDPKERRVDVQINLF